MKTYRAGETVPYGVYFSTRPIDMLIVSEESELLAGKADVPYRYMPTWMAVFAGPAIGGVFVMAFPAIIFAAIFMAMGRGLMGLGHR